MRTAKDIMTGKVITVTPETTVEKLAEILWKNKIAGAPVVDEENNVVGVVTESDLIDQTKKFHIPTIVSFMDSVIFLESDKKVEQEIKKMTGTTVIDICSKDPVLLNEDSPLDEIATIMAEKKMHTLPVVRDRQLIGIVGKADVIKTIVKS